MKPQCYLLCVIAWLLLCAQVYADDPRVKVEMAGTTAGIYDPIVPGGATAAAFEQAFPGLSGNLSERLRSTFASPTSLKAALQAAGMSDEDLETVTSPKQLPVEAVSNRCLTSTLAASFGFDVVGLTANMASGLLVLDYSKYRAYRLPKATRGFRVGVAVRLIIRYFSGKSEVSLGALKQLQSGKVSGDIKYGTLELQVIGFSNRAVTTLMPMDVALTEASLTEYKQMAKKIKDELWEASMDPNGKLCPQIIAIERKLE